MWFCPDFVDIVPWRYNRRPVLHSEVGIMRLTDGKTTIRDLHPVDEDDYIEVLSDPLVSSTLRGEIRPGGSLKLLSTCSEAELREKFRHTLARRISGKPCFFAIEDFETARFIGSIGSYPIDDIRLGLSYWIASHLHGRGIGSSVLNLYCLPALKHFGRAYIVANIALDNPASKIAALKAGFVSSRFKDDPGFEAIEGRELLELAAAPST